MRRWNVGSLLALAVLAGCGGSQAPSISSAAAMLTRGMATTPMAHFAPAGSHRDFGPSWTNPKKVKSMLLYISDWATYDVYLYNYWTGEHVGTLTGFNQPMGQCVDGTGNVFITNYGNGQTIEYAHGGTSQLKTYFTEGTPVGCSVDRRGDLAVTSFNPGNVTIFAKGKSKGQTYSNDSCKVMWPAGYDERGNLYSLGESYKATTRSGPSAQVSVCEIPVGGAAMLTVTLSGANISYPGSVMWDGKYITLTDQGQVEYGTGVYQTSEESSGGLVVVGTTNLQGGCYSGYTDVEQPFFVGKKNTPLNFEEGNVLVGVNTSCLGGSNGIVFWPYPQGGDPFKKYSGVTEPDGISVSIGSSGS
ncbi:MAG TPA: hypothetical protein VGI19_08530 [Candidatus Cybelea sp.]|jgi:hypothetical protein